MIIFHGRNFFNRTCTASAVDFMTDRNQYHFSGPVTVFRDRALPEGRFQLGTPQRPHRSHRRYAEPNGRSPLPVRSPEWRQALQARARTNFLC
jgi:hypothetical protein